MQRKISLLLRIYFDKT